MQQVVVRHIIVGSDKEIIPDQTVFISLKNINSIACKSAMLDTKIYIENAHLS